MKRHFTWMGALFSAIIINGYAENTSPDQPRIQTKEITRMEKRLSIDEERITPRANFDVKIGARSDFLPQDKQVNFGTVGGEFGVTLNPIAVDANGYYGRSFEKEDFEGEKRREETASIHSRIGGMISFSENDTATLTPFAGFSYDGRWIKEQENLVRWMGPMVGFSFEAKPTNKLYMRANYSHHFLEYKDQLLRVAGASSQPSHGEKVGIDAAYALKNNLNLGVGASYLYYYKDNQHIPLSNDLMMHSPSTDWHAVEATAKLALNF